MTTIAIHQAVHSAPAIRAWLQTTIAELLDMSPTDVDPEQSFFDYGLDSSAAIGITDEMARYLGHEVDPVLLYDHPTISRLAKHLAHS
jgi:aryl carrier-like protein